MHISHTTITIICSLVLIINAFIWKLNGDSNIIENEISDTIENEISDIEFSCRSKDRLIEILQDTATTTNKIMLIKDANMEKLYVILEKYKHAIAFDEMQWNQMHKTIERYADILTKNNIQFDR